MTRQLGIAVIGLGIGEQHARMYATQPSCAVKLLVEFIEVVTKATSKELGVLGVYDMERRLMRRPWR